MSKTERRRKMDKKYCCSRFLFCAGQDSAEEFVMVNEAGISPNYKWVHSIFCMNFVRSSAV